MKLVELAGTVIENISSERQN